MTKLTKKQHNVNLSSGEQGLGLVETIAAMGIAVLVITSLVSLAVFTLNSSTRGKLLLQGSKLGNTQLELVRSFRDAEGQTWESFINAVKTCTGSDNDVACHIAENPNYSGPGTLPLMVVHDPLNTSADPVENVQVLFYVSDPLNGGNVEVTDSVVRVNVRARWMVSGEPSYTYVYTDLTNWQGR